LAAGKLFYDHDWTGTEQELQTALGLNPRFSEAHSLRSVYLSALGRFDEAIAEAQKAYELDPFQHRTNVLLALWRARRWDLATELCKKMLATEPLHARGCLADTYYRQHRYQEAFDEQQAGLALAGNRDLAATRAKLYAEGGQAAIWNRRLGRMKEAEKKGHISYHALGELYTLLGQKDLGIAALEKAYLQHETFLVFLNVDTDFDGLRSDPRFKDLIKRLRLPEADGSR
jgi:tetratricopeptide (TPR) repeat protein